MRCNYEAKLMLIAVLLEEIAPTIVEEARAMHSAQMSSVPIAVTASTAELVKALANQLKAQVLIHRTAAHGDELNHDDTVIPWITGLVGVVETAMIRYLNGPEIPPAQTGETHVH